MKAKRWMGWLLCLVLCVGLLPVLAEAAGDRYLEINEANFPDPIFRQWIINNKEVSGDADSGYYMTEAEVKSVRNIWVNSTGIENLKGIEHFTALTSLICSWNRLTALDVSKNTALNLLHCEENNITALDVSQNAKLEDLDCGWNKLTALDVSHNKALTTLNCGGNGITALDVSNNTALKELICYCSLDSLDVSHNKALIKLNCGGNALTALDVSNNPLLTSLSCSVNMLTALDVSQNTVLEELICWDNPLVTLDVSNNTALKRLQCSENQLTALDVSRNTSLTELDCGSNQLTTLDVSHNTALETLLCNKNKLTNLNVSNNSGVKKLWCQDNRLTTLDVSQNAKLEWLDCHGNKLTKVDVSRNPALIGLGCQDNQLTMLDVRHNAAMEILYCDENKLTTLDVSHNLALETLHCYNNQLATLDLSANTALTEIKMAQKFKNQTLTMDKGSARFDLSTFVPLEKMDKVTVSGDAALNKDTGIVTFSGYVGKFTYQYATGHGAMDVTVYFRPIIITQPKDVTVEVGQTATITVEAVGEHLTYQWESRPNAESEWTVEWSGKYEDEIHPIGYEDKNGWQFRCIVKGEGGETCSDIVTLTVKLKCPTIAQQPKDVKAKSGAKAKFTVKAKEKDVTYQWYEKAPDAADWAVMKGETKNTLTVTASGANNGYQYRCLMKNKAGGQVYSNAAKLTVTLQPPVIKTQPKNVSVKSGAKAKISIKVSGKNLTYAWYSRPNANAEWTAMAGQNKNALNLVATAANNGWQFRCVVKNGDGEVTSGIATLTVKTQKPVIKTQPKSLNVKSGKKVKFTVKASGKNITYQWFSRADAKSAWKPVPGGNKNTLNVVASKANNGSQYYCYLKNADGDATSVTVTLTVTPEAPTIKTQPKDAKVKIGAKAKFKVKATGKNVTYQWYYRTSETGKWILMKGQTSANLTVTATANNIGWQFRCLAKNADGQVYSNPATLRQK